MTVSSAVPSDPGEQELPADIPDRYTVRATITQGDGYDVTGVTFTLTVTGSYDDVLANLTGWIEHVVPHIRRIPADPPQEKQ